MKFIALDLETSGLFENQHQILEIGAVVDDLANPLPFKELQAYHAYVTHKTIVGDPFALSMHPKILERIAKKTPGYQYLAEDQVLPNLTEWLLTQGFELNKYNRMSVTLAGKNVAAFDLPFLRKLPGYGTVFQAHHRTLDPAMLYLKPDDQRIPDLATCLLRAGLDSAVAHTAVEDSLQVIQLLRKHYGISF